MDEFDLIKKYFAPLARNFRGSLNLTDDAALIDIPKGQELIVTTDAIVEGVHFIGDEDAGLIAQKLLRVNLSDLAAMGAKPLCYFLSVMLPASTRETWVKKFARGLARDQKTFGIHLAGGDTTSTKGGMAFSLTAIGSVPKGKALRRNGAKQGDLIYVSGTLGDSALGLMSLRAQQSNPALIQRYLLPEPRVQLGQKLRGIASSCMDISDGLVQDLGHICKASGVGAIIHRDALPLSKAAATPIKKDASLWDAVLGGGDDYELLFTVPVKKKKSVPRNCTCIGVIKKGSDVCVLDKNGKELEVKHKGFRHF